MAKWGTDSGEVAIKVAIVGQPGAGKSSIIRALADTNMQAAVRTGIVSEAEVMRTEFIWPDPIPDGPFVRVKVFALSGNPLHQAAEQLLLVDVDALVFVVDCDPAYIAASRDRLLSLMTNARHLGLDWSQTTVVMHYNRTERYPHMNTAEVDAWLGIEAGKVARHTTTSQSGEHLTVAVNDAIHSVITRLIKQADEKKSAAKPKLAETPKADSNGG
ncbi:MAG: 50S ribosome-binding GTPase [Verrucomicrobiae bacterium]|nr:50S ribosome-binding GTPase [Verrucomicrobiae bacterium]NNJ87081.1 hypothetical protein [Akkermansiaceae bacterium]